MRVLLVDDDVDGTDMLAELLRRAGHDVRTAADPPGALRQVAAFDPEVAVIDIALPVMDGYHLAREIRAMGQCRLIALSGYDAETSPGDGSATGFEAQLVKPVDCKVLLQKLEAGSRQTRA